MVLFYICLYGTFSSFICPVLKSVFILKKTSEHLQKKKKITFTKTKYFALNTFVALSIKCLMNGREM